MSRRRRAALLLGLALLLGGLAAGDVARREARLDRSLGPLIPVLVARADLPAGTRLSAARLAVRRVPARYAPADAVGGIAEAAGARTAVPLTGGGYVTVGALARDGEGPASGRSAVGPGERVAEVLAAGSAELVRPGGRVDVLVTREGAAEGTGETTLALEDVEVLAAAPATESAGAADATTTPGARVTASLRVTLRQAVYLAAAQSFAREVRLLPRAPGDRRRGTAGLRVSSELP